MIGIALPYNTETSSQPEKKEESTTLANSTPTPFQPFKINDKETNIHKPVV
jgi:hypothetical protein